MAISSPDATTNVAPTTVTEFLLPQTGQNLQVFFFIIIAGAAISTIIWALATANEQSWSRHWQGGLGDHGSIHDVSDAVASRAERLCDILPGILLVMGLLGTFIGLGLALDEAAHVLAAKGLAADLSEVTKDIGTKFRTSTWGIIAFLFVRAVTVAKGWDDQRLRWCIGKINTEAALEQRSSIARQEKLNLALQSEVARASLNLSKTLTSEFDKSRSAQLPILAKIERHGDATQASLSDFVKSHVESMKSISDSARGMKEASLTMSGAAQQLDDSATRLGTVIGNFGTQVEATLGGLETELVGAIGAMQGSFNTNLAAMSDKIATSTTDISSTMKQLGKTVGDAMKNVESVVTDVSSTIGKTVEMQVTSMDNFRDTSEELSRNAMNMQAPIEELKELLSADFKTIADVGSSVASLNKKTQKAADINAAIATQLEGIFNALKSSDLGITTDLRAIDATVAKCNDTLVKLLTMASEAQGVPDDRARGDAEA